MKNLENKEKIKENSLAKSLFDFFKDLIIIIIIVIIIRSFIAMPFKISWSSMLSSYYDREFIIVDRLSYLFSEPKRWDVIVFKPWVNKDKEYFLKRIIWMPWDTLKLEDWEVYIKKAGSKEFKKLDETYLNEENKGNTFVFEGNKIAIKEYKIGKWEYFVMWDNRNHSTDSRECFSNCTIRDWYVWKEDMVWKVFLDIWYFNFSNFSFIHPDLWISTIPRFFSSPSSFNYDL